MRGALLIPHMLIDFTQQCIRFVIVMKEALVRQHPSLPCQREVAERSEVGGIRRTRFVFAEDLGEHVHAYRRNPPPIN